MEKEFYENQICEKVAQIKDVDDLEIIYGMCKRICPDKTQKPKLIEELQHRIMELTLKITNISDIKIVYGAICGAYK